MQQAVQQTMTQSETEIATQSFGSAVATFAASLATAVASIASAHTKRKAIADLRQLDDRMLADIGLSRSDIVAAVNGEIYRQR